MKYSEFLIEADMVKTMTASEIKKHDGQYIKNLIKGIGADQTYNFNIGGGKWSGNTPPHIIHGRILNPKRVRRDLNAILDSGDLAQASEVKLEVQTDSGEEALTAQNDQGGWQNIYVSNIVKDEHSTGALKWTIGSVAEAIMGCVLSVCFKQGTKLHDEQGNPTWSREQLASEAQNLAKKLIKNTNLEVEIQTNAKPMDPLKFNLSLPRADGMVFKALVETGGVLEEGNALSKLGVAGDRLKAMNQMWFDAALYGLSSPRVKQAIEHAYSDQVKKQILVASDGADASNQKSTKVDLKIYYGGQQIKYLNLISLKAQTVEQFGQVSGASFEKIQEFFNHVGVQFSDDKKQAWKFADSGNSPNMSATEIRNYNYGANKGTNSPIGQAYSEAVTQINAMLAGDNETKEAKFIEQLWDAINYHATRKEEGVYMVILSPSAKKAYYELQFGKPLLEALKRYNLKINSKIGAKMHELIIYGAPVGGNPPGFTTKERLVRFRTNWSESAIRNVVEMGPLLKELADWEKLDKEQAAAKHEVPADEEETTPQL